ncbi:divalent-cation tolerance protein CutA [Ramlibacter sp. AW1]|uniref:Divalent-cation tolerance protein CutA n=1 Tax=Ramlibacter aurantiacus TaxID=2801330 RepID=A0A937D6A1_9BURK|nr:divalent-cation tolerance protein CutA [Ramlibacter aurantiacus]MBL0422122.1 divalent-cation tolerance protein CutA [Ramlibacter aurantiacus]
MTVNSILSLTTTVGSELDAQRLARELVQARLAACVQVDGGLVSHYRWDGASHADREWRLTIKSLPRLLAQLQAFLAQHHPYELPQLVWQQLDSSEGYAEWVRSNVIGA